MRRIHAGISLSCKLASLFLSLYLFFSLLFTLDLYSFRSLRPFLFLSFFFFFQTKMGLSRGTTPLHFSSDEIFRPWPRFVPGDGWLDIKKLGDCEITRCHRHGLRGLDSGIVFFSYLSLFLPFFYLPCCHLHRGSMLGEYLRSFDKWNSICAVRTGGRFKNAPRRL